MTLPLCIIGIASSDFVSGFAIRYRGSADTSGTSTGSFSVAAAPRCFTHRHAQFSLDPMPMFHIYP